jgi:hypothetical protein
MNVKAPSRVLLLILCLGASAARADLLAAHQAYEKQDFETAFTLFKVPGSTARPEEGAAHGSEAGLGSCLAGTAAEGL